MRFVDTGMKARKTTRKRRSEAGIALLIAIFVLLLVGVVGIALVVSSGTESALAGNYRSSTSVYYAAEAGLEEVRARLRSNNPNSFNNLPPNTFLPPAGTPLGVCTPVYVINPVGGEAITPWNLASAYADNEFGQEFAGVCGVIPSPSPWTLSIWNKNPLNGLAFPGPLYKWVRINGVSEQSLGLDTCPFNGLPLDPTPLFYGVAMPPPAAPCNTNPPYLSLNDRGVGSQVLEVTALAVLPNNSQKLLQYLVAPEPIPLPPFLAALTLSGSNAPGGIGAPSFQAPANNAAYSIVGNDQCNGNPAGVYAVGLFGDYSGGSAQPDVDNLLNGNGTSTGAGIPLTPPSIRQNNYPGLGGTSAIQNVQYLTGYPANFESPSQLDAVVQAITQNADSVLPSGPVSYPLPTLSGSALTSLGMSATNPMTVVINGNLDVTNWTGTGYGTLVVIGTFTYDPATAWNGIVLVIGQGVINNTDVGQTRQINGAVFVAKTRDANGNLLSGKIGGGSVSFTAGMQAAGIRYSSCWIATAQPTSGYKILSFHEISQ